MTYQKDVCPVHGVLKRTQKCIEALTPNSVLKGKTRQYCLLLSRNDAISHSMCQKLRPKVDIAKLIEYGYIEVVETSVEVLEKQASKRLPLKEYRSDVVYSEQVKADKSYDVDMSTNSGILKELSQSIDLIETNEEIKTTSSNEDIISPILQIAAGTL